MVSVKRLMLATAVGAVSAVSAHADSLDALKHDKVAQEAIKTTLKKPGYSPYAGRNFPTQVYWGDTHLHTNNSLDARGFGVTLGMDKAYRFARGEEVTATHGEAIRLSRPLDFLVVADHSDAIGAMKEVIAGNPTLLTDPTVKSWHQRMNAGGQEGLDATMEVIDSFSQGKIPKILIDEKFTRSIWEDVTATADRYNEPGRFTAFIGYEWTSTPDGNNLHRVVIYRDGADKANRQLPSTVVDSVDPKSLWEALKAYEEKTGGNVLAIPHNGNLSNGLMFAMSDYSGKAIDKAYAQTRMRWEPIVEMTQIKGDGETHPLLSPNDEFADYETWAKGNLNLSAAKKPEMLPGEYARSALLRGLELENKVGANPYKFGMIGATDSHTALATAEEENFFGKHAGKEPKAERAKLPVGCFHDTCYYGWEQVASGLAAVWATENTREALFDAMERKEVYGTTGPRITVRFFGGWDFTEDDVKNRLPANIGYDKGVPMGGDLTQAPSGKAPTFLVAAAKDPYSGNLDRIQIIKGRLDGNGKTHEKVYDVVWSGDRQPDANGKLPPVGNTVDVDNATWTNTIGDPELIAMWTDPDFDPQQRAFYYARVIEIPTPRWTAYDAKRFGAKMDKEIPMTTQERAYTSPIWYTP